MIGSLNSISGYYNFSLNTESTNHDSKSQETDTSVQIETDKKNESHLNSEKQKENKANELSEEQKEQVEELEKRDQEVKAHEQAHIAAAGGYAIGGAQYEYTQGPDGKQYVINGHVNIDTSAEGSPEETLRKAEIIRSAALAPSEPSAQDMKVAARASELAAEAQKDIRETPASKESYVDNPNQTVSEISETDTQNSNNTNQEGDAQQRQSREQEQEANDPNKLQKQEEENQSLNQRVENTYNQDSVHNGSKLFLIA